MIFILKDLPENDKGMARSVLPRSVTDRMPLSSKSGDSAVWLQRFEELGKNPNSGEHCWRQSGVGFTSLRDGVESASISFRRCDGGLLILAYTEGKYQILREVKKFRRDV